MSDATPCRRRCPSPIRERSKPPRDPVARTTASGGCCWPSSTEPPRTFVPIGVGVPVGVAASDDDASTVLPSLSVRIQETVRWFGVGLSPLLGATRTTTTTRNRNSNHDNSNIREWVENALVDCLWLLGATLTSLEWKAPPLAGAADARALPSPAALNFHPSVRALIVIVRALLASPFFCRSSSSSSGISSSSGVEHGATNDGTAVPVNEDSDHTSSFSSSSGLARKLQKNWFPVLLEAVDAIRVVAVAAAAASSSSNNSNSNARALPPGTTNDLMKRLRQYNTAANYRQQKYSLLQEDSEGYSKLLQHLCSGGVGVGVGVGVGNSGGSTRTGNTHSSGGVVSRNSNTASTSNTNATTTTTTTDSSATDIVVSDVDNNNNINNDNNHHPNNNGRGARS